MQDGSQPTSDSISHSLLVFPYTASLDPRSDLELLPIVVTLFHSGGNSLKEIRVIFLRSQFYWQQYVSVYAFRLQTVSPVFVSVPSILHTNHCITHTTKTTNSWLVFQKLLTIAETTNV